MSAFLWGLGIGFVIGVLALIALAALLVQADEDDAATRHQRAPDHRDGQQRRRDRPFYD